MTTREEFILESHQKGMTKNQIAEAMLLRRQQVGAFDDDPPEQKSDIKKPSQHRLFGLSEEKEKTFFPRAVETRKKGGGVLRTAFPGAFDILSIPGRAVASIPSLVPGGETPQESFGRKTAKPQTGIGKVGQFVGTALRDPVTLISAAGTGGASVPVKAATQPILKRISTSLASGAKQQIAPAVTRQIEESSRTGEIDIPSQVGEAVFEIGSGAIGESVGKEIAKKITPFGKKLLASAAKIKDVTAKKAGRNVAEGVDNLINDVVEFKLESPTGGFSKMVGKATKAINKKTQRLNKVVDAYSTLNPNKTIDVDSILKKLIADIKTGKTDIVGGEEKAGDLVESIVESLRLRNLSGRQPIGKTRDVKAIIDAHTKPFELGSVNPNVTRKAEVGRLAYRRINDYFGEKIPEAAVLGNELMRLINVQQALFEAQKRVGNNNFISLRNSLFATSAMDRGGSDSMLMTLAAMLYTKATEKGRGPSALIRLGRQTSLPRYLRAIGGELSEFSSGKTEYKPGEGLDPNQIRNARDLARLLNQKLGVRVVLPKQNQPPLITIPESQ